MKGKSQLAKIREKRGLSQRMLANVANISHITIARIEMGTIDPRISTLKALAKALNVKISALVD